MAEGSYVTACQTCGDPRLKVVLDMGAQPLAERDDGNRYPLAVAECAQCGLAQLTYAVDREVTFPPGHPYATGNTRAMRGHFEELARDVARRLGDGDLIVDIGANDGTFLDAVRRHAPHARLLAVEPTGQVAKARRRDIPAEQAFWTRSLARDIARWLGRAKVITASNVLAHCADAHDFLSGISELLAPGGVFITENHDWAAVVNRLQVDTVYHEHLRFYSPATLGYLLAMHGFLADEITKIPTHGGSFRTVAIRQEPGLQLRADAARCHLRRLVEKAAGTGKVYGISASTRATPLIWWAGISAHLDRICEVPGSDKIGTMLPGTVIPVVDERELIEDQPPYALLLAWHVAADIVPKLRAAGYQGRFIVPLPQARIWNG
jgi:hypothetical protein